jgi:RHS repeat-associated protein
LFDPWGNIIGLVKNGVVSPLPLGGAGGGMFFDRGYTGHEHLHGVGLINMNARLYDAKLHRFLQADNFVSDPKNTQKYNRYAYCLNNPLSHIDPSGNEPITLTILAIAMISTAVSTTFVYIATNLYYGTPITTGGIIGSFVMGAISGAITCGIGSAVGTIANFYVRATVEALAHGLVQGVISDARGEKFSQGFNTAVLSSISASAFGRWGGTFAKSLGGQAFFGALAGGAGARLSGGNFWQGAVTGASIAVFNHYVHRIKVETLDQIAKRIYGENYKKDLGPKSLQWASEMPKEGLEGGSDGIVSYDSKSQYMQDNANKKILGVTTYDRRIFIANICRENLDLLVGVIGHELIHSYHRLHFGVSYSSDFSENAASTFSMIYSNKVKQYDQAISSMLTMEQHKSSIMYSHIYIPGFKNF